MTSFQVKYVGNTRRDMKKKEKKSRYFEKRLFRIALGYLVFRHSISPVMARSFLKEEKVVQDLQLIFAEQNCENSPKKKLFLFFVGYLRSLVVFSEKNKLKEQGFDNFILLKVKSNPDFYSLESEADIITLFFVSLLTQKVSASLFAKFVNWYQQDSSNLSFVTIFSFLQQSYFKLCLLEASLEIYFQTVESRSDTTTILHFSVIVAGQINDIRKLLVEFARTCNKKGFHNLKKETLLFFNRIEIHALDKYFTSLVIFVLLSYSWYLKYPDLFMGLFNVGLKLRTESVNDLAHAVKKTKAPTRKTRRFLLSVDSTSTNSLVKLWGLLGSFLYATNQVDGFPAFDPKSIFPFQKKNRFFLMAEKTFDQTLSTPRKGSLLSPAERILTPAARKAFFYYESLLSNRNPAFFGDESTTFFSNRLLSDWQIARIADFKRTRKEVPFLESQTVSGKTYFHFCPSMINVDSDKDFQMKFPSSLDEKNILPFPEDKIKRGLTYQKLTELVLRLFTNLTVLDYSNINTIFGVDFIVKLGESKRCGIETKSGTYGNLPLRTLVPLYEQGVGTKKLVYKGVGFSEFTQSSPEILLLYEFLFVNYKVNLFQGDAPPWVHETAYDLPNAQKVLESCVKQYGFVWGTDKKSVWLNLNHFPAYCYTATLIALGNHYIEKEGAGIFHLFSDFLGLGTTLFTGKGKGVVCVSYKEYGNSSFRIEMKFGTAPIIQTRTEIDYSGRVVKQNSFVDIQTSQPLKSVINFDPLRLLIHSNKKYD